MHDDGLLQNHHDPASGWYSERTVNEPPVMDCAISIIISHVSSHLDPLDLLLKSKPTDGFLLAVVPDFYLRAEMKGRGERATTKERSRVLLRSPRSVATWDFSPRQLTLKYWFGTAFPQCLCHTLPWVQTLSPHQRAGSAAIREPRSAEVTHACPSPSGKTS